jgi:serine/threonine protein kinase
MGAPKNLVSTAGRLRLSGADGIVGGKYRVFASVGRGGMGDIQLATAPGPKGVNKLLADDATVANMFLDEARLAARLNHPNVIHTYEFGGKHGGYFLVMEYLDGQPLHEVLAAVSDKGIEVPGALWARVAAEALAGLHYAHELRDYDDTPLGVVHRDVSPQNIVLTYEGGVKLVDFGIAKAKVNVHETESEMIKGKLAYMAPEQAEPRDGDELDRRADVFSMGIVLWECLTLKRLIKGDVRTALAKIADMTFLPPSSVNPSVPVELDAIVLRALERVREKRYQTAAEMRDALGVFLQSQPLVGERQIADLLVRLFSAERESVQRQIRAQMSSLVTDDMTVSETGQLLAADALAAARAEPPSSRAPEGPVEKVRARPPVESMGSLDAVRTSGARSSNASWMTIVLGVLALTAAVIATSAALRNAPGSEHSPSGAVPARAATIQLSIQATPVDATILFDGATVGNPFVGRFVRDAVEHRLQVARAGYVPSNRVVRFDDGNVDLDVTLEPSAAEAPPPTELGSGAR